MAARFIRMKEVMNRTGFARSTVYYHVKKGSFPKSVRLGPSLSVWVEAEVEAWILDHIRQRDEINATIQPVSNSPTPVRAPVR